MAFDLWPSTLPQQFLLSGFSQSMGDARLRSSMDSGPAKVRNRSSAMPDPVSGQIIVTANQLEILRSFVRNTLMGGSLPFLMNGKIMRFRDGLPSWKPVTPDLFTVSLDLEVLP